MKRYIIQISIILTFLLAIFFILNKHTTAPNFIIIFADDQGYNDLGCYGSEIIKTPNIDLLAKEGIRFTDFYAQPICGPSRAALLTGCYPLRVAEKDNKKNIHPVLHTKEITIAEILKTKGYATACFGKWDLAGHSQDHFQPGLMPNNQGFDYFFGTPTSNDNKVNLYQNDSCIEKNADMAYLTQRYTDEAISFIERSKDQPFFVYIPLTMPHTKLAASPDFIGKSERGLYGDVIDEIDYNVGRIREKLTELKLDKNTWVFYLSDNGPWLIKNKNWEQGYLPEDHGGSAKPLRSGKVSTWEGGVRIPAIAWAPGNIPEGKVNSSECSTMDLLPTIAKLAGAEVPSDRIIDGKSILEILQKGNSNTASEKCYFYYFYTNLQAVRKGKWKLHLPRPEHAEWLGNFKINKHISPADDVGFSSPALFNLENDPAETTDVANQYPEIVNQLLKLAEKARKDIGDYNRIGEGARFYDDNPMRPDVLKWQKEIDK